jgi:hypothetical protein
LQIIVPFANYSKELELFSLSKDSPCLRTLEVEGRVITGTGRGVSIVILVNDTIDGKRRFFLHIYDPQMSQLLHRIALDLADDDAARFVDISHNATRIAVLTFRGLPSYHMSSFSHKA